MDEIIKQIIFKNAAKIDLFLIGKTFIEIVLFIIILRIVNKTLHLFFDKLLSRISDTETKKHYQTLKQLGTYIIDAIIILFFATNIFRLYVLRDKFLYARRNFRKKEDIYF